MQIQAHLETELEFGRRFMFSWLVRLKTSSQELEASGYGFRITSFRDAVLCLECCIQPFIQCGAGGLHLIITVSKISTFWLLLCFLLLPLNRLTS
jgi:hypothetical protein